MHIDARSPISDESGMMIIQVVIVSGVLLAMLLMGYEAVQVSNKSANTAASSAAFNNLIISVQQTLAVVPICSFNVGLQDKTIAEIKASASGFDTQVVPLPKLGPKPIASPEPANAAIKGDPEFRITSVKIKNVKAVGLNSSVAAPTKPTGTHTAELEIMADRRGGFLGGGAMTGTVPLVLTTYFPGGVETVKDCSVKTEHAIQLGPDTLPGGVTRKVAWDCSDRGGAPVLAPGEAWYVCRLPISSFAVCKKSGEVCGASSAECNIPGWYCYQSTQIVDTVTMTGFTYAY